MASFSVRNRVAMFEKPSVDTEPEAEVSKNIGAVKSPVSPGARSASSYLSSYSHKSARSSPLGEGPYSSARNSPRNNYTSGNGVTSPRTTTPRKPPTPKISTTPRRKQQTKRNGKIASPFMSANDQASKPVVLPSKSSTVPPGWGTANLRSTGLVSGSPFKNADNHESEEVNESRDASWSAKKEITETRDEALLKNSLNAASVVLEEEKSNAGSSNASSRSSLSTMELSDIAKRALNIAKKKSLSPKPQHNSGPSVLPAPNAATGSATTTPSQSWKAAAGPAKKTGPAAAPSIARSTAAAPGSANNVPPSPGAGRVKNRAAAVAAAKRNRAKTANTANSAEARRALLANAKKNKEKKDEAARHLAEKKEADDVEVSARLGMKASRVLAMKNSFNKSEHLRDDTSSVASFESNRSRRIDHPAFAARAMGASPKPKKPDGNDADNPFSAELISSFRHFSAARTEKEVGKQAEGFSIENDGRPPTPKTLRAAVQGAKVQSKASSHTRGDASMDDSFLEQEDSLHSMSGRNYFEEGAYLSSMSGSNAFSMMSSMNDQYTPSNTAFRKYGVESAMSPGPSMRSGHSMAHSIISTTPTAHSTARNADFDYLLKTPSTSKTSPADPGEEKTGQDKDNAQSIRSGDSGARSTSPPGFVLEEGVKKVVGAETSVKDFFGDDFFKEIEVGSVKDDATKDDDTTIEEGPEASEGSKSARDVSMSSKDSINTSIRTGLSSIQNEVPDNGSKSMRSGLSGIFPEASQHPSMHQSRRGLPDTIREEEEKDTTSAFTSGTGTKTHQDDRDTTFDGTTFHSEASVKQSHANTPRDTQTEPSDTVFEGVSQASSKKSGSWWKGKKVKSKIKTALSKKSTKAIPVDDDIFGGLEDEKTMPVEEKQNVTRGTPKIKTQNERKNRGTKVTVDMNPKEAEKVTVQNEKSIHSTNDRSGTNVEYEELDDVESEITTSILGDGKKHLTTPAESKAKTTDLLFIEENDVKSARVSEAEKESASSTGQTKDSETNHARCQDGPGSIFMNLGCGIGEMMDGGFCNYGSTAPTPKGDSTSGQNGANIESPASPGNLSAREEQVWKEWENQDASTANDGNKSPHDKKREEAHGKLLDIANSALSGMSEDGDAANQHVTEGSASQNGNLDAEGTRDATDASIKIPTVETKSAKHEDTRHSRYSALSASTPMTLSNNQRSLVEKFSKHLSNDGVEVLKLNTKKQWQVRFFTISKEQITLSAHEALKPSGDVAQCPKALLWVKKFSSKNTYGISNIDKLGHGGMMLASLVNVQVTSKVENKHLIPKKMQDKFKKAVVVTLDYNFDGADKTVEFLCRDNDQAQFLCTCIRVSRDLLKREETLRQRLKEI